jgi:hypothetical protein
MKRCIETHDVASFGTIPEGSLWDDDSPYVTDDDLFVDADAPPVSNDDPPPVFKRPVKKSAAKLKES